MSREIPLSKGYVAIVDDEDYERVTTHHWYAYVGAHGTVYGQRKGPRDDNGKRETISLHRFVLGLPRWQRGGLEVDHINRDGLDNRRVNLRLVTHQGNALNRVDSVPLRSCDACGRQFKPSWPRGRFCSMPCVAKGRASGADRDGRTGRFTRRDVG